MYYTLLDWIPLWLLLPLAAFFLWLAMEAGYRIGEFRRTQSPDEKSQAVGAMVASILGLLALVLGFTFSFAASRFEARRQAVVDEANAIGTAYLRTQLLPEPERAELAKLLREYVDHRIISADKAAEEIAESEKLHGQLWAQAASAANKDSHSVMAGLFIQSLNEVIDLHTDRMQAGIRSRIPLVLWISLFALALIGMGSVGYHDGLAGTARSPALIGLVLAFSLVLYLITDLDRGHEGLLRVGQHALIDLQRSMQAPP
jgi:hypothetical protein